METVFIRSQKRRGQLFNTLAVPEATPTGMNIVIVGVIAVADTWALVPIGDTVLLDERGLDKTDEELAISYPVVTAPIKTVLIPVNAPPGMRL